MKRVIATAPGFHDGTLRIKGEVFSVEDNLTGKWFMPASEAKPESPHEGRAKPQGKPAPREVI